jgi:phage major head subunit gpT-like protein
MLKTENENPKLTPIEKIQNDAFGFVQNLASAAALNLVIERLEEVEQAIENFEDDEEHRAIMPTLMEDKAALEKAIIDLAELKMDAGISA